MGGLESNSNNNNNRYSLSGALHCTFQTLSHLILIPILGREPYCHCLQLRRD